MPQSTTNYLHIDCNLLNKDSILLALYYLFLKTMYGKYTNWRCFMKSILIICGIIIASFATSTHSPSRHTQSLQRTDEITCSTLQTTNDNNEYSIKSSAKSVEQNEKLIKSIEKRVSWIVEHFGEYTLDYENGGYDGIFVFKNNKPYRDYYNGDTLVCREGGVEYVDSFEGGIGYNLLYDKDGCLIFASIVQYRYHSYIIYFNNDKVIRFVKGGTIYMEEPYIDYGEEIYIFDECMENAISLCLENAYK